MIITWILIGICLCHSALFSGLNLGFFGISRLSLAVQSESQNLDARRILKLRKDAHLLLATLLWGNVSCNVLLALFAESVLSGVAAFLFSTIGITFLGEIIPQAYLAKNTLKASVILVPVVKMYQVILYPLAKPTALLLDKWLGKEKVSFFQENEIEILLKKHENSEHTNLGFLETMGAINFLKLDDVLLKNEGEHIDPNSIIRITTDENGKAIFPSYKNTPTDPFIQEINKSGKKWIVAVNEEDNPVLVLDADHFLRDCIYGGKHIDIHNYCHSPIIVADSNILLGHVILKLKVLAKNKEDDVIDHDVILLWDKEKRIITGADILGRLLRGIVITVATN